MRSVRNHHIWRAWMALSRTLGLAGPRASDALIAGCAGRMNGFDMAGNGKKTEPMKSQPRPAGRNPAPGWQDGLRKLYDSVVEEPIPSSFDDLLKKLDKPDGR